MENLGLPQHWGGMSTPVPDPFGYAHDFTPFYSVTAEEEGGSGTPDLFLSDIDAFFSVDVTSPHSNV